MPENPLLPHRRLKELYELMKRIHASGGLPRRGEADREALLAAAVVQLEPGDVLCGTQSATTLFSLPLKRTTKRTEAVPKEGALHAYASRDADLPALSQLLARGMKSGAAAVIALSSTRSVAAWTDTLQQAQKDRLPLVLIFTDRQTAAASPITWPVISKLAKKIQLPTITVDGEDAVAIYRVIQESLHRAKHGDGPALIWCSYTSQSRPRTGSHSLANMEGYLAARGLLSKARKT